MKKNVYFKFKQNPKIGPLWPILVKLSVSNFKVVFPHIHFSVTWDLSPLELLNRIASLF